MKVLFFSVFTFFIYLSGLPYPLTVGESPMLNENPVTLRANHRSILTVRLGPHLWSNLMRSLPMKVNQIRLSKFILLQLVWKTQEQKKVLRLLIIQPACLSVNFLCPVLLNKRFEGNCSKIPWVAQVPGFPVKCSTQAILLSLPYAL